MSPDGMKVVGMYTERFNNLLQAKLPCGKIYMSPGFHVHIRKRHPDCIKYIDNIQAIISDPDYIGRNPKEPDSIELIKVFDKNIQVAIKLDTKEGYLYVASLYDVVQDKVLRRVNSGRLLQINKKQK